ncbi:MAG: TIGR00730 family Rossman fold protein [Candidatus Aminicenantes bacterium]|nr:TIGR00730 family Rossman fold protein [Candidatus Aminicenantes bacterium]RLE01127.1 MAG: TIGR00730 family Rossman fold protein [Candidatus Aminicenantes bacterium]RLE06287.1 MAG: TIGR00730 family Rossman fold protein [Candidatus Aminicenantes bacterium]
MQHIYFPQKAYKNLEFLSSEEARVLRILSEYLEPLTRLAKQKVHTTILFLGSARVEPEDKTHPLYRYYWEAEELAYRLARWAIKLKPKGKNFVICTGGGPGIMEAANRGAQRAGGKSIGMNISLPHEQFPNPYISPELSFIFHYFFMRKFWLSYKAKAVVAFPGGFGTLDELFELLTLVQTEKIDRENLVILLYGEEYWRQIINFEQLVKHQAISPEDLKIFTYKSTPEEAFRFLQRRLRKFLKPANKETSHRLGLA